jgi:[CysO sulfur-carrier protein]-S-L-cysteine hydrolase
MPGWFRSYLPIPILTMLVFTQAIYTELLATASEGYPEEICGLIAGIASRAIRLYPIENIHHSPVSYEMDPVQQIKAMLSMEADGLEMVAIYHSHPHGPPYPSPSDVAQAYYPEAMQIIISINHHKVPALQVFTIQGGQISSVDWMIAPDSID